MKKIAIFNQTKSYNNNYDLSNGAIFEGLEWPLTNPYFKDMLLFVVEYLRNGTG